MNRRASTAGADGAYPPAYQWQVLNGSTWTDIAGETNATFDIAGDQSLVGKSVRLTVRTTDDFGGTSDFESAPVTIQDDNVPPVIDAPNDGDPATLSVAENTTAVTTIHATDGDGDSITYSIVSGGDGNLFSISSTGVLTFQNAPDFENPADSDTNNSYVVTV